MFTEQADTRMTVVKVVPIRIFGFLPGHVWKYDISDLPCRCRCGILERSNKIVLDIQGSVGLGVFCGYGIGLDSTVQLRFLQSDADIHADWADCDGSI